MRQPLLAICVGAKAKYDSAQEKAQRAEVGSWQTCESWSPEGGLGPGSADPRCHICEDIAFTGLWLTGSIQELGFHFHLTVFPCHSLSLSACLPACDGSLVRLQAL